MYIHLCLWVVSPRNLSSLRGGGHFLFLPETLVSTQEALAWKLWKTGSGFSWFSDTMKPELVLGLEINPRGHVPYRSLPNKDWEALGTAGVGGRDEESIDVPCQHSVPPSGVSRR